MSRSCEFIHSSSGNGFIRAWWERGRKNVDYGGSLGFTFKLAPHRARLDLGRRNTLFRMTQDPDVSSKMYATIRAGGSREHKKVCSAGSI